MKNLLVFSALSLTVLTHAQSVNVDFNWNGVGTVPASTYGAAGQVGVWNNANVSTNSISNLALVDLGGSATSATVTALGFGGNWSNFGSWIGNDESLMEDLIGSGSSPLQVTFSGLLNGVYKVNVYGQNASGNSNSLFTINNVSQTTGGAWTGSHVLGGSFTSFANVPVVAGSLTIDYRGNFNGVQLSYAPVPEPASLTALSIAILAFARKRRPQS